MKPKIAIIGSGISGLTLAHYLDEGADVTVFEKARGVGGRMSTRYADDFYFDHGTQYFTCRGKGFKDFLAPYTDAGIVADWTGKVINLDKKKKKSKRMWFEPHYVACPNMNSLCKVLAEQKNIQLNIEVAPLSARQPDGWHVTNKNDGTLLGVFDWVISTAPQAQTITLFGDYIPVNAEIHSAKMLGCYALMLGFKSKWDKQWIAANVDNCLLRWISINSTKPQRNKDLTTIVTHSTHEWAEENMNLDMQSAQNILLREFEEITGINCQQVDYMSTHRWKYAILDKEHKAEPYFNDRLGLGATGDWCTTSRIESVWDNSLQLSTAIMGTLR